MGFTRRPSWVCLSGKTEPDARNGQVRGAVAGQGGERAGTARLNSRAVESGSNYPSSRNRQRLLSLGSWNWSSCHLPDIGSTQPANSAGVANSVSDLTDLRCPRFKSTFTAAVFFYSYKLSTGMRLP